MRIVGLTAGAQPRPLTRHAHGRRVQRGLGRRIAGGFFSVFEPPPKLSVVSMSPGRWFARGIEIDLLEPE
jgi:hypothetical protein